MSTAQRTALVVEDDRSWQAILGELLGDAGLSVDLAGDLAGAQALIDQRSYSVAVVDLSLRGHDAGNQDGLKVLDALQRQHPDCTKILLTGYATVEIAVHALTAYQAHTCLRKEVFQRQEFLHMVEGILAAENGPAADAQSALRDGLALVVEDDPVWRAILSELLEDAGHRVRTCSSFAEALGALLREQIALAVVDLSLQGTTGLRVDEGQLEGYRLLTTIKSRAIPAIVVSGVGSLSDIENAYREQDVFAYLEKQTFDRTAFLDAVAAAARLPVVDMHNLTEREREVLGLLARGMTNKEIARTLVITENTVKRHLKSIFEKLDVHTRAAAAAKALTLGL